MTTDKLAYDYVVVGSGAAGGIVFDELSKRNKNVLLVEKGLHIKSENLKKEFFYSLKKIWKFSGYQYASGNISLPILQGISLGGSTTINGSIMQSLDESFCKKIVDHVKTKNQNFKYNNLLNIQDELREEFNIKSGSDEFPEESKLLVEVKKKNWECKFLDRALSQKYNLGKVLSGNSIENTILRKYQGINILANTEVQLIIKDKSKILGISCFNKNTKKKFFIKVNKKLIISCGVIESAKLLMKSKIKNNNLGKKFSCHLSGAVDGLFSVDKKQIEGALNAIEIITDDKFCKKFANQNVPDEIILSRIPLSNFQNPLEVVNKISSWVFNVSSSEYEFIKKNFFDYKLKFNISNHEFEKVKKYIYQISEFLYNLGAIKVFPNILNKNNATKNMEEIKHLLNNIKVTDLLLTASHLFGTCCISDNETNGVVNEEFKVFNYDNLFIVDASVFPFPTSYNPQLTIMVYAKLASEIICDE
jgi:hypothetical protein